ncbi:MAG: hypothetical protein HQL77_19190 [Magnetococcales bacterium]|nr:hypothetical protein [Magnetococcales bacterium]
MVETHHWAAFPASGITVPNLPVPTLPVVAKKTEKKRLIDTAQRKQGDKIILLD